MKTILVTCPTCSGQRTTHNPSTHDDVPCSRCRGTGTVTQEVAVEIADAKKLAQLAERLRSRAHSALDAGDTPLATLLSEAAREIARRS